MAINDGNTFDPSRRIRAALGEEFSNNLEGEAIARLSAAMASNGMRKTTDYTEEEDNEMAFDKIKNIAKNIVHTNPAPDQNVDPVGLNGQVGEERVAIRKEACEEAKVKFDQIISKKSFGQSVMTSFGINTKVEKKDIPSEIAVFCAKNATKLVQNDFIETAFRYGNNKRIVSCAAFGTVMNFGAQMILSGDSRVEGMFNQNVITSAEAQMIKKAIKKERVKYAAQHTAATVVIPSLIKFGIDKIAGDKIRDNKILSAATSYCVLSEIGNISLKLARRAAEKKAIANFNNTAVTITENDPIDAYKTMAKIATNCAINETICDSIGGALMGSTIAFGSVKYVNENETASVVNKFVSKPASVKPEKVEVKPAVTTSEKKTA